MKQHRVCMRWVYTRIFKKIFFLQDPETVHNRMIWVGARMGRSPVLRRIVKKLLSYTNPALEQKVLGIHFKNPVGLAAGFDKDGHLYPILESVGFGFSEIGTVTWEPCSGNPRPRLFRLPKSKGIVVNYGLKNEGVVPILNRVKKYKKTIPYIVSIGKTNCATTVDERAGIEDYIQGIRACMTEPSIDAYEINISCPNTYGGEPFTTPEKLRNLLEAVRSEKIQKPIILKMPINFSWEEFRKLLDVALDFGVHAVNIGNLNKNRFDRAIVDNIPENIRGSVSGKPTGELSNKLISETYRYCGERIVIIGTGGIFSAEDAYEKMQRGASLVELITGMIYEGPQLIGSINYGITQLMKRDKYKNISEVIGAYHRKPKIL